MKNKILIVDDTNAWLMFHSTLIKELYGNLFEITLANSARNGLEQIKKNINEPFSLIMTDLQMETDFEPKLAGEWLVERIKKIDKYNRVPIVIISGMYNIEHTAKMLNVDCISKSMLVHNKLLLKFMFEKSMPFLNKI
jgi:DNA-binding NtrC family response regulator